MPTNLPRRRRHPEGCAVGKLVERKEEGYTWGYGHTTDALSEEEEGEEGREVKGATWWLKYSMTTTTAASAETAEVEAAAAWAATANPQP